MMYMIITQTRCTMVQERGKSCKRTECKRGNRAGGSTEHFGDKIELVPGPMGKWRGGECEVRCGEEVAEFR